MEFEFTLDRFYWGHAVTRIFRLNLLVVSLKDSRAMKRKKPWHISRVFSKGSSVQLWASRKRSLQRKMSFSLFGFGFKQDLRGDLTRETNIGWTPSDDRLHGIKSLETSGPKIEVRSMSWMQNILFLIWFLSVYPSSAILDLLLMQENCRWAPSHFLRIKKIQFTATAKNNPSTQWD